jgi:hypothetical protein
VADVVVRINPDTIGIALYDIECQRRDQSGGRSVIAYWMAFSGRSPVREYDMGWYLKKSFPFGPLRLNLSKSGLGASLGVKGLRVSAGPKGKQIHAGREGLYYRASLNSKRPRRTGSELVETKVDTIDKDAASRPATADAVAGSIGLNFGSRLARAIFRRLLRGR